MFSQVEMFHLIVALSLIVCFGLCCYIPSAPPSRHGMLLLGFSVDPRG